MNIYQTKLKYLFQGLLICLSLLNGQVHAETDKVFEIIDTYGKTETFTLDQFMVFGTQTIRSAYFDRAMDYRNSKLTVISLQNLAERFDPEYASDALLLNCFDDYQGIVSMKDVHRYKLKLATQIAIGPEYKKPSWLNPLLIVVPNGVEAPFQERFLTANIRQLQFVRLDDYYAPLKMVEKKYPNINAGAQSFKDNCIFCHSLKGIGGNKGINLLRTYDFSSKKDQTVFQRDFLKFHNKNNSDKQNVEQFLTKNHWPKLIEFLKALDSN